MSLAFIEDALQQAEAAGAAGEVPVGAVVVRDGTVIAAARNRVEADQNPQAHAEMLAIAEACRVLGRKWLEDCDLYVTLEPRPMRRRAVAGPDTPGLLRRCRPEVRWGRPRASGVLPADLPPRARSDRRVEERRCGELLTPLAQRR